MESCNLYPKQYPVLSSCIFDYCHYISDSATAEPVYVRVCGDMVLPRSDLQIDPQFDSDYSVKWIQIPVCSHSANIRNSE